MRKITLLAVLLVGILAGRAQSAIVGTYTGVMNLTQVLAGTEEELEDQAVTIAEEDGKINVTFPSIKIALGPNVFESGELQIEDVAVTDNGDGSYDLEKSEFNITAGILNCNVSTLAGTVYDDGSVEITITAVQGANTMAIAYFYAEGEAAVDYSAIVGSYNGGISISHIDGRTESMEEQTVTVSEADGKVSVVFPSFLIAMGMETGVINVDVEVTANADGSYSLSNGEFQIGETGVIFPVSTFSGKISANGDAVMTIEVKQNPVMALTTAKFSTGEETSEPETPADPSVFEWGTATWNTEDGVVYNGIAEFEAAALTLTYPNPTNYALSGLNMLLVNYDLYIDGSEEPVKASASAAPGTLDVAIDYAFVEGHEYRIVTTKSLFTKVNLATFSADTLTTSDESYSISFTVKGPELQKTIEVEAWMSLYITNQNDMKTVSEVDVNEICSALGISDISEAEMHPIRPNGSYCDYMSYFDWWRDADGDFTTYNSGYNNVFGHNAYPAVYCIKVNEAADSVTYYFYDYWTEIVAEEGESTGGSTITRAPQTVYSNDTVNWDNGDGTYTEYRRSYRVEEGKDYVSEVMYVANMKSVILRATLHFVSVEEWMDKTAIEQASAGVAEPVAYYSVSGVRQSGLQKGINIVCYSDGTARKVMVK